MKHTLDTKWNGNMQFESNLDEHVLIMDATPESGGEDTGARPKKLMLASLAGCTGMDVIVMLKKMRVVPKTFHIKIEAGLTEDHPKQYTNMHLTYEFTGEGLNEDKIRKAVELSQEQYCGVSAVYRKTMPITYDIKIIE